MAVGKSVLVHRLAQSSERDRLSPLDWRALPRGRCFSRAALCIRLGSMATRFGRRHHRGNREHHDDHKDHDRRRVRAGQFLAQFRSAPFKCVVRKRIGGDWQRHQRYSLFFKESH